MSFDQTHVHHNIQKTTRELGWEVLSHPPYSPDLAPSDYHLFRGLKAFLKHQSFQTSQDLEKAVVGYFESKPADFYWSGIHELPNRWAKVIAAQGNYWVYA